MMSKGAAHNINSQVRHDFGKSVAVALCAAVVVYFVFLFGVIAYKMADCGAGCLTWWDPVVIPCSFAMVAGMVALAVQNLPPGKPDTRIATPVVPTPKVIAAPVGAPGRRAPAAPRHAAGPKGASPATLHKGAEDVKEESPSRPRTKEQSSAYLGRVEQVLSQIGKDASDFAEAARTCTMGAKGTSPAAELITVHEVSEDLLEYIEDVPDQLTAQAEALQHFVKVYEDLHQDLKEARQDLDSAKAEHRAEKDATRREIAKLQDDMDFYSRDTQRILLGETVYVLESLVEDFVYEGGSSGFQHDLTLRQLKLLYKANKLNARQASRWEQVVAAVDRFISVEQLVVVESHLRTERRDAAHGYDYEKENASLAELKRWAGLHFSPKVCPQVHAPLIKMLDLLAACSSNNMPCLPDRSFESSLHAALQQKR